MTAALHDPKGKDPRENERREFLTELGIRPDDPQALAKITDYARVLTQQMLELHSIPEGVGEEEVYFLTDPFAPHETAGVLRMLRGGMKPAVIAEVTGLPLGPQLTYEFGQALDQEGDAHRAGLPVFDGMKEDEK